MFVDERAFGAPPMLRGNGRGEVPFDVTGARDQRYIIEVDNLNISGAWEVSMGLL